LQNAALMRALLCIMLLRATAGADDAPHAEITGSVGAHWMTVKSLDTDPAGKGPFVDLEGAWRFKEWFSTALFTSYSAMRDTVWDMGTFETVFQIVELGVRLQAHGHGFHVGLGVGVSANLAPDYLHVETMSEVHAGYTFPPISGVRLRLFASIATGKDEWSLHKSSRLALGVQFR